MDIGLKVILIDFENECINIKNNNQKLSRKKIRSLKNKLKDIEYYITKDYKAGVIDKETFDNLIEKYRTLINSVIQ